MVPPLKTASLYLPLAVIALLVCAEAALGCPTCKDQLANDPAAQNIARGYFYSILFMLSMPALILAGMSTYFYLLVRQARRKSNPVARRTELAQTATTRIAGA